MEPLFILALTATPLIVYSWYRVIRSYGQPRSSQAEQRLEQWSRRYDDQSGVRRSDPPPKRRAA